MAVFVRLSVRLPASLHGALNKASERNRRTINAEITERLAKSFSNGDPLEARFADLEARVAKLEKRK